MAILLTLPPSLMAARMASGPVDQRLDVVDLPVNRVGQRVPAPAAAAAIKAVDREVRREQRGQFPGAGGMDGQCAVDQNQGRSLALAVITDRRAVARAECVGHSTSVGAPDPGMP